MFKRIYLQIIEFSKEMKSELKKVTYPTKGETIGSTAVVLVFVMIVGIFLALVDALLVRVLSRLIE